MYVSVCVPKGQRTLLSHLHSQSRFPCPGLGPATLCALHGGKLTPAKSPERPAPSLRGSGNQAQWVPGDPRQRGYPLPAQVPGPIRSSSAQPSPAPARAWRQQQQQHPGAAPAPTNNRGGRPCPYPSRPVALPGQGRRRPPASRPPPAAAAALTQAELGDISVVGPAEDAGDEEHRHPVEQPLAAAPHATPSARRPGCRRCRHLLAPHPGRSLRGPGPRPRSPPEPAPAPPSRHGRSSHRPPAAPRGLGRAGQRGETRPRAHSVIRGCGWLCRAGGLAAKLAPGGGAVPPGAGRGSGLGRPPRVGALGRGAPGARRCFPSQPPLKRGWARLTPPCKCFKTRGYKKRCLVCKYCSECREQVLRAAVPWRARGGGRPRWLGMAGFRFLVGVRVGEGGGGLCRFPLPRKALRYTHRNEMLVN